LNAPASAATGASVTLTANVASTAGTPAGTVTFYNGTTVLGSGTLNGGVAVLTTTALPAGNDALTAVYAASGNFGGSTSASSNIHIAAASQTITFPAIASRPYGSAPFAVSASSSLGSGYPVTIAVQSGPAVINGNIVTITGAGAVVLLATQAGNAQYGAATATQSFQVTPVALTVTANSASRTYGAANPTFSGTVTGAVGSDSFSESFSTIATTASNVGSYAIVPAASGPQLANYTVTVVNGTLTVNAAATTTTVGAPTSAAFGASVTLTATVTSSVGIPAATPSGSVTFYSGATILGTGTLNGGVATLATTALASGSDSVSASYAAFGNFAASTSAAAAVTIGGAAQTIAFPAIASRVYGSGPFAVTASSSLGIAYPVTITVKSGPAAMGGGMISLTGVGTVVLQASQAGDAKYPAATALQSFQVMPATLTVAAGNASRVYGAANPVFNGTIAGAVNSDSFAESFTTTATTSSNVGTYAIVPSVTGAQLANYTISTVNGALAVTAAATATTLAAPSSAAYGASVTLTATVASNVGTPGGSVTFSSGAVALGTGTLNGGVATINSTTLPAGSDTVTATYAAAGNYAGSTSSASTVTIAAAPIRVPGTYTVAASPTTLALAGISSAKTMLTFTPTGGYSGAVQLSCANLPTNTTCTFDQNQVTLGGDNKSVTLGLTIQAMGPHAISRAHESTPVLVALAFCWPGSITALAIFVRRRKLVMSNRFLQLGLLLLCTGFVAAGLSGCGAQGVFATSTTAQVTVVATGTSGTAVTTQKIALTLNMTE
jgi:Bacterial Ig-like domain (group 3)/MBG domain (YGX type)